MTDGWPGVEFAPPPPVTSRFSESIRNARRNIDAMEGILDAADLAARRQNLETVEMLHESFLRGEEVVGLLIELGLSAAQEGLAEFPDRLATAYRIADRARSIEQMAVQLQNAEALYESDISDSDLGDTEALLTRVERDLELG